MDIYGKEEEKEDEEEECQGTMVFTPAAAAGYMQIRRRLGGLPGYSKMVFTKDAAGDI